MRKVFSRNAPVLRVNALADQIHGDEQYGFMMLFSGAVVGLRNPTPFASTRFPRRIAQLTAVFGYGPASQSRIERRATASKVVGAVKGPRAGY
jgi:hypothetical protein